MSFRIDRVYTRSGDSGETGLVGGARVPKHSPRVSSYGEVDELNSFIGLLKSGLTPETGELFDVLEFIQQELFDLGSELATPPESEYSGMIKIGSEHVLRLEKLCDFYGAGLPELQSFILPGGSHVAAYCHICRSVCRRAERKLTEMIYASSERPDDKVPSFVLQYLNRLSDLFFIFARWSLKVENRVAPLWERGGKPLPKVLKS